MNKFFSRKFIICLLGILCSLSVFLIQDADILLQIIGSSLGVICAVSYMIVEGRIDAKNVDSVVQNSVRIMNHMGADNSLIETAEKVGDAITEALEKKDGDN